MSVYAETLVVASGAVFLGIPISYHISSQIVDPLGNV